MFERVRFSDPKDFSVSATGSSVESQHMTLIVMSRGILTLTQLKGSCSAIKFHISFIA